MKLFSKFRIVEVEGPKVEVNDTGRAALSTLKEHPGFIYLINRLRLQRAALETALKTREHQDIKQVYAIQSGIRWMTWLENQFLLAVQNPTERTVRQPNQEELEALEKALEAIELVGK